jgi:hypothetical protein
VGDGSLETLIFAGSIHANNGDIAFLCFAQDFQEKLAYKPLLDAGVTCYASPGNRDA